MRWREDSGRERGVTVPTRKAALQAKSRIEVDAVGGLVRDPRLGRLNFGHYIATVLDSAIELRPATLALYRSEAKQYVLPALGDRPIGSIQPADLREFYAELGRAKVGVSTIEVVHRLVSRVMKVAVQDGLIAANPATGVHAPRPERQPVRVLNLYEVIRLAVALEKGSIPESLDSCNDDRERLEVFADLSAFGNNERGRKYATGDGVLALLAFFAGLRFGEVAALRTPRLKLDEGRLRVEVMEAVTEVAGKVEIGPTKTRGSRRTIPLPREPVLARILQAQIENAEDRWNYLVLEKSDRGKPLLFTTLQGHPLSRTRFRARKWVPAVELAGITPPPNFHDLRHSYAAWLIQDGAHAKTLQDRLGHASSRTSLDLYGHLMQSTDDAQIDSMSVALGRDSRGTLVARRHRAPRSDGS